MALHDPIVAAWAAFRDAHMVHQADTQEQAFYDATDAADEILGNQAATNLDGVAAKLRRAFITIVQDMWAQQIAFGNDNAETRGHLAVADVYIRMFWGAIEDVERLAAIEPQDGIWHDAHQRYLEAKAAAEVRSMSDEQLAGAASNAHDAFTAFLNTPAPTFRALRTKMDLGLEEMWKWSDAEPEEIRALLADLTRLSEGAQS